MNELKPCPFCGDQEAEKAHDDGLFWIRCKSCGATGPANTRYSGEEGEPFTDWNTRAIPDTHRVVSVETLKDAERYAWLKSHAGEKPTQRSLMNEFSENKTEYVFPRLIAWADFCGQITLDEAIDFKISAIAEQKAIIDNKEE